MTNKYDSPDSALPIIDEFSFAVVGLARDCESTIRSDIFRLKNAIGNSSSIAWLIVESDSSDGTINQLKELESEVANFSYVSLGGLRAQFPSRTDRISFCRNYYAEQLRSDPRFQRTDYVVVADLDGVNDRITNEGFRSCWIRSDWDMCAANQSGPYYDIWALRHDAWCPGDCWAQYRFLKRIGIDEEQSLWRGVYSKMVTIPQTEDWIEVRSAFGGLAIYKKSAFDVCEYLGITEAGDEVCEHVHFHGLLKQKGARLFINPRLINTAYTEHSAPLQPQGPELGHLA